MRSLRWIALAVFASGVALLAYSVAVGESQLRLVLLFPVVTGGGAFGISGIALVFLAMVLGFLSFSRTAVLQDTDSPVQAPGLPRTAPATKFGGVVFLGPLPIVFGSSPAISKFMLVLAVVMTVLLLAFFFLVLM